MVNQIFRQLMGACQSR